MLPESSETDESIASFNFNLSNFSSLKNILLFIVWNKVHINDEYYYFIYLYFI